MYCTNCGFESADDLGACPRCQPAVRATAPTTRGLSGIVVFGGGFLAFCVIVALVLTTYNFLSGGGQVAVGNQEVGQAEVETTAAPSATTNPDISAYRIKAAENVCDYGVIAIMPDYTAQAMKDGHYAEALEFSQHWMTMSEACYEQETSPAMRAAANVSGGIALVYAAQASLKMNDSSRANDYCGGAIRIMNQSLEDKNTAHDDASAAQLAIEECSAVIQQH